MDKPIALVTGASSGIGMAVAEALSGTGVQVFAGVRRPASGDGHRRAGITPVPLDVTSDDSVAAAVETVLATVGRIDVLVNNARYGQDGSLEDAPQAASSVPVIEDVASNERNRT